MDIELPHGITYTTKEDVPVSIVAKTLLANEYLIRESIKILEDCFPDLQFQKTRIKVSHVSNASPLRELLALSVVIAFQKDLAEEVPDLVEKLTGYDVPDSADTLVTVLVLVAAIYIISNIADRVMPGKDTKKLKAEYKKKLDEFATVSGFDREQIEEVIENRYKESQPKTLIQKVQDFFLPAKLESGVTIEAENLETVSASAISEIPDEIDYELAESRKVYELQNIEIDIHRSDRDQNKHGWRAIIETVTEKQLRMELSPEILPSDLYGKIKVVGDVTVVEELQEDGTFLPKLYHLMRVKSSQ